MKRLQVFLDNNWQYVFCRNELYNHPVITQNKNKAIKGNNHSLDYFSTKFANLEFRIYKEVIK